MHANRRTRWLACLAVAGALCGTAHAQTQVPDTSSAKEQAQRKLTQPGNNAPVWREVRGGESPYQTTQVRGIETNILVQSGG